VCSRAPPRARPRYSIARHKLAKLPDKPRHGFAILVNSGNANTFTGARGVRDVDVIAEATAQAVGVPPEHVFTSSTGVIGEPLDATKITDVLPDLVAGLHGDDFRSTGACHHDDRHLSRRARSNRWRSAARP
jgi:N-acetylglutamate synthase/N-acetylornithine aminotransferase